MTTGKMIRSGRDRPKRHTCENKPGRLSHRGHPQSTLVRGVEASALRWRKKGSVLRFHDTAPVGLALAEPRA